MSLNVTLRSAEKIKETCYHCGQEYYAEQELFYANITHNLGKMAQEAGIYLALWRPEEIGATIASDITDIVETGLTDMLVNPDKYKEFDSPNGWGIYVDFMPWIKNYLEALKKYPDAVIEVSR